VRSGSACLASNQTTRATVDAFMAKAKRGGAKVLSPAKDTFWGGYAGCFADPDGHPWEIAWNPHWKLDRNGNTSLT
jgi:uncharacterized glyoxalase superfamily protein PhnB